VKCINSKRILVFLLFSGLLLISGCSGEKYKMAYDVDSSVSSFRFAQYGSLDKAHGFAYDLCVTDTDVMEETNVNTSESATALLCDVNKKDVIFAKSIHEQMEPASLTKVLTALVALKHADLEDQLVASSNVKIQESGASLIGLEQGDVMTLDQALHALLLPSGNDAAILIAENIGGSVEGFAQMMNDEAKLLGATNSHFVNPHGLTQEGHYVTAYDLYLIFNEAIKYDKFTEIINTNEYNTIYRDKNGDPKEFSCSSTNLYLKGTYNAPEHVTVIGGKTGTTNSARNCLVLLAKDGTGSPYISIILKCKERGILYEEMTDLLYEIN